MMRQKLRILVLKHLALQPRSGYDLIKQIEEHTGWKPSYGSIYPTLEHLHEEKLVTFKEEGRSKVYSLTKQGEEEAKGLCEHSTEMFDKMHEHLKLMAHMIGFDDKKHDNIMEMFVGAIQKGETPFKQVMRSTTDMKMVFWELYKEGKLKKNAKAINKIMDDATAKLKLIK